MEQEKVYVAVGKEYKEGKPSLVWALQNISKETKIVLLHVHCPSNTIPIMGARFAASQLQESQIGAYRLLEREKMHTTLHEYLTLCSHAKVQAEMLVIDKDDIGKGLAELIALHGIKKLVMGTKQYSRKTRMPKSKIAISFHQQADPSCNIWFICKGNLICTREAGLYGYGVMQSPIASSSRRSVQSEPLKLRSLSHGQNPESVNILLSPVHEIFRGRSRSVNFNSNIGGSVTPRGELHLEDHVETLTTKSTMSTEGSIVDPREGILSSYDSLHSMSSVSELLWDVTSTPMLKDEGEGELVSLPSVHEYEEEVHFLSTRYETEAVEMDNELYEKLHDALMEAERLKREAYEESQRRQKAEMESIEAARKVKESFSWYSNELKRRKELEETLARKNMELENLKTERDKVHEQESLLRLQIADSNCIVKNLEGKLSASHDLLNSLQRNLAELQQERDIAVRVADELRKRKEDPSGSTQRAMNISDFSYSEIKQATKNFDDSMKIGEGGYGSVYKGFLRHTTVAIKMLNPESMQGQSEFHQEVDVLSRVRHPHLVTLIGTCSEAWALIYEYCSNGSLEDRLVCKDNTPPLHWKVRIRIASEICASLIFLHSSKPHSIVHGDLKPANILMDGNLLSKLGDFGICRLLIQSTTTTTLYRHTQPKGTFVYVDPEFIVSGELTPSCDVFSFGMILLRLLTGRPALGVIKVVQLSLNEGRLHEVLDPTAGDWPFVQAKQLVHLALRCCEIKRKKRPDLEVVWKVLEPMTRAVSSCSSSPNLSDGITYEAEAIKGCLDSGHDTSPVTNLKLQSLSQTTPFVQHSKSGFSSTKISSRIGFIFFFCSIYVHAIVLSLSW